MRSAISREMGFRQEEGKLSSSGTLAWIWDRLKSFGKQILASDYQMVDFEQFPTPRSNMDEAQYKLEKERFVTGFSGSTLHDVGLVCAFMPVATLLRGAFPPSLFLDFLLQLLPCVLSVMWTEYNLGKLLFLLGTALFLHKGLVWPWKNPRPAENVESGLAKLHYITEYRAIMLLATAVSILAVDFPAYPRRFVKCETYGISLMDLGTGSVLFASALVSRQGRKSESKFPLSASILSVSPLLVMGVLRFAVHKFVNYQEHVSEYGVHWNFFLSIAAVVVLSSLLPFPPLASGAFSALLVIWYQRHLDTGLSEFVLTAPRTDFFSQNREGILGVVSFLAIYQAGLALRPLFTSANHCLRNCLVLWICFAAALWVIPGQPSRRLNNLAYVISVLEHNCLVLTLFCVAERIQVVYQPSMLVRAISYNQLPYFMLSNLLTGGVNLLVRTLYASDMMALAVVTAYQVVAVGVVTGLYHFRIRLKYW